MVESEGSGTPAQIALMYFCAVGSMAATLVPRVPPAQLDEKLPGVTQTGAVKEPEFVVKLPPIERDIFRGIVEGNKDQIERLVGQFAQEQPGRAMDLFITVMTPAIRYLGDLFGARQKMGARSLSSGWSTFARSR